jgi:hypothetical protein
MSRTKDNGGSPHAGARVTLTSHYFLIIFYIYSNLKLYPVNFIIKKLG